MWMHETEVDMMLYSMQLESLNSDERLRRNRHPKLQQDNSSRLQQHTNIRVTTLEQDLV